LYFSSDRSIQKTVFRFGRGDDVVAWLIRSRKGLKEVRAEVGRT
jgi:hypothetical protein